MVSLRVITNISYGLKVKDNAGGPDKFEKLIDRTTDQNVRMLVIIVGRPSFNQIVSGGHNQHFAVKNHPWCGA